MTVEVVYLIDDRNVQASLERLDAALSPAGLMLFLTGVVGPWLRERAEDRFKDEGDDVSGKWAPLQPATQEIRSRGDWPVSANHPINVRTTELEDYITKSDASVWGHSLGASLMYPGQRTTRKSITEKMRTAQMGRQKPRTVPRPVLGMNERDLAFVMQALVMHVNKAGA